MAGRYSVSYIVAAQLGGLIGMALSYFMFPPRHISATFYWSVAAIFLLVLNVWLFGIRRIQKRPPTAESN